MLLTNILTNSAQQFSTRPVFTMRLGYRTVILTYKQDEELSFKNTLFLADQGLVRADLVLLCFLGLSFAGLFMLFPKKQVSLNEEYGQEYDSGTDGAAQV